jgi:hypothetical protein
MQVMSQSTTVLSQILRLVSNTLFDNLASRYRVNKHASVFTGYTHFAVLLYAQLSGLNSTRDLQHATTSLFTWQRAGGLVPVKKSSLADANKRIDWRFYRDLFHGLLPMFRNRFDRHRFPIPGDLLTLDSTLIPVCLNRFPWATYRRRKGALKLHTLLNHDGHIPDDLIMTSGKVHDIRVARTMEITEGTTYLLDRGYTDMTWLHNIHTNRAFFVTRLKVNMGFNWLERSAVDDQEGVRGDWIGHLDGNSGNKYPDPLRLVKYLDPETEKEYWFLTNLMDITAKEVAELYRQRWQIELFFKWIKQNLKIKTFLGTSENAVMSQIWVAMIAFLLLRVIQMGSNDSVTTHQLLIFISTNALVRIHITQAWLDFQRTKSSRKKRIYQQTRNVRE